MSILHGCYDNDMFKDNLVSKFKHCIKMPHKYTHP